MNVNLLHMAIVSGLLMCSTAFVKVQSSSNVAGLTVPDGRLSPGCALTPTESKPSVGPGSAVVIARESGVATPTNPWSGADRRLAAAIRESVDGVPPQPDGPPLDRRALAAYALKWADNVVEAYRATYRSADESLIDVLAVRFDDEALALSSPPAGAMIVPRGVTSRVVIGATVVRISASADSDCFQAIGDYVRSLR